MPAMNKSIPSLPDEGTAAQRARALQLSLSRTAYNYVRSYPHLESVPLCAGVPAGEEFSAAYNALVGQTSAQIAENFACNVRRFMDQEIKADLAGINSWHPLLAFQALVEDVEKLVGGMLAAAGEAVQEGPTAILKSTLFDMVQSKYLEAKEESDYESLIVKLPTPQMMAIEPKEWMLPDAGKPWEQDWFFGYLQVAGFNTTNLRRVVQDKAADGKTLALSELQAKMKIPDTVTVPSLGGSATLTLADMVNAGKLYACDYAALIGDGNLEPKESCLHDRHRYLPSPIALFYWNESPPKGYPSVYGTGKGHAGALQPFAIQLDQKPGSAIFSPDDAFDANDAKRLKWKIAKYFVNVACAIQHESVAHLGDCHLIMEAVAVATHRQLAQEHPLFHLLEPHLRFTIGINDGASHNLIVPGGVVAANVGANIAWTLQMVNDAREAWRWSENSPDKIFSLRGVDKLAVFPFRDDTLLLWKAIQDFVAGYVASFYPDDASVSSDPELRAWVEELGSPDHGHLRGFPAQLNTRAQLVEVVAQMIYTAGPLHASVNYGQYPFAGNTPSVAAAIYKAAPTREDVIDDEKQYLAWLPPLDVALYTVSFVYLLSSIQFDVLGHYASNPQYPHFADRPAQKALEAFQAALAQAEITIHQRNLERPIPYLFQLPSRVPNSISI